MIEMTQAWEFATKVLANCETATMIGTSAVKTEINNKDKDIDIAVVFEDVVNHYGGYCLSTVRREEPVRSEDGRSLTYTDGTTVAKCEYKKNKKTKWLGVEKITFEDGSTLDLLYYKEKHIEKVRQAMKMLLSGPDYIWEKKNKKIRVKIFESLVSSLVKEK